MDFLTAYENHVWPVYGYLAYRTTTREEAEDLTQLTFERALKAWARFDPTRASARTWLLTIARNALIDEHRRSRPEPVADVEEVYARRARVRRRGPRGIDPGRRARSSRPRSAGFSSGSGRFWPCATAPI